LNGETRFPLLILPEIIGGEGFITDGDWVESVDQDPSGSVRLTQLADVGDGVFRDRSDRWMNEEQARRLSVTYLKADDLLIARMPDPLGRACVCPRLKTPAVTVVDVCIVRTKGHNPRWLMYAINAPQTRKKIALLEAGTTRKRISKKNLSTIPIPVPPLPEQNRIVTAIEAHFSRLDAAVASLTRARANVKRARASVLKAAVEGRLVPNEAALSRAEGREYEPASVLLQRILAEGRNHKPLFKPEFEGSPELPEGWAWAVLGTIAHIERGGSPRPIKAFITDEPDGLNWIKIGDTKRDSKYITAAKEKIRKEGLSKTRKVFPGDFLLTNSMSFGRPYIILIEGCIHDGWLRIHPPIELDKDYLYVLLSSPFVTHEFKLAAAGAVVQNLNIDKVRVLQFPLPPVAEQARIAVEVDRRLSILDVIDTTLAANLARCARLRQSILKRAFEGRLVSAEDRKPSNVG
jgi:type I restriction enzyme S subunit